MCNISLQDPAKISKTFLDECCKSGLGSGFSKRDVDVLVFFLLLQDERYKLPEDIFIAFRELKLSETKVRRLYQDAQLRYMQYDEEEAKKKFVAVVESCFGCADKILDSEVDRDWRMSGCIRERNA